MGKCPHRIGDDRPTYPVGRWIFDAQSISHVSTPGPQKKGREIKFHNSRVQVSYFPPTKPIPATCATERIIICVILLGILSTMPASAGSLNWCGTRSNFLILVTRASANTLGMSKQISKVTCCKFRVPNTWSGKPNGLGAHKLKSLSDQGQQCIAKLPGRIWNRYCGTLPSYFQTRWLLHCATGSFKLTFCDCEPLQLSFETDGRCSWVFSLA